MNKTVIENGQEKKEKKYHSWECQKCGYEPPDDMILVYFVIDNKLIFLENGWILDPSDKEKRRLMRNEQVIGMIEAVKRVRVYPLFKDGYVDYFTGECDWTTVHFCPNCNEEFEF